MTDKLDQLIKEFRAVQSDPDNLDGRLAKMEQERKNQEKAELEAKKREALEGSPYGFVI